MAEIRNLIEGTLWWVQASGSGVAWATASAPTSGLIGYVTTMTYTSAQTLETVMNRGTPTHHKVVDKQQIAITFDLQWGVTGDYPTFSSGSGASVPMIHLEHKATAPEATDAIWTQFHGVALESIAWTEAAPLDTQTWTMRALAMNGPTASGYVS
jgi:hypothetical protein